MALDMALAKSRLDDIFACPRHQHLLKMSAAVDDEVNSTFARNYKSHLPFFLNMRVWPYFWRQSARSFLF